MQTLKIHLTIVLLIVSFCLCFGNNNKSSFLDIKESDVLRLEKIGTGTGKVIIGNQTYSKGESFLASKRVKLSGNEYIKMTNTRTGARFSLYSNDFKARKALSVFDCVKKISMVEKGQSDLRAIRTGFASSLQECPWPMIEDTIIIPAPAIFKLSEECGFSITKYPGGTIIPIPNNREKNENDDTQDLVLSKDYLQRNGISIEYGHHYRFIVEYWVKDSVKYLITDNFIIQYIPIINYDNEY